jgi:CubicO group peptidase (beta-lactamase class C family)
MGVGRRSLLGGGLASFAVPRFARATGLFPPGAEARAKMAALAEAYLTEFSVPGVSVAFAEGGALAYEAAFGVADTSSRAQLTPAHRLRLASVSKPITSVAIFTLIDAGRLELDAKVFGPQGVLRAFGGSIAADSPVLAITVRHLLQHTAGGWGNAVNDPMFRANALSHADLIAWTLANARLPNAPGAVYEYSNFGYCLLGRIVETASGKSYETYTRETVLAPNGAGGMVLADNTLAERRHDEVRYHGAGSENPYGMNVRRMDSHGGWLATAAETARFAAASGLPLLGPASMAAMGRASMANPSYASGWSVNANGNRWHTGSLPGTQNIAIRTRRGFGMAGLTNTRNRANGMAQGLDRLMWAMARCVPEWRV